MKLNLKQTLASERSGAKKERILIYKRENPDETREPVDR
jgi:hypothetical protein